MVAAYGSWLDARACGGRWLLRIEDLDPPRVRPGAVDDILRTLDAHGLHWDGPVLFQSTRSDAYAEAVDHLESAGRLRRCACSRALLAALTENKSRPDGGADELFHPPECLAPVTPGTPAARRLRVDARPVIFTDRSLGRRQFDVAATVGDFVLQRRDGLYAYQLAVTVDDASQGVTDVVRGADLLSSTARQLLVQRTLGLPEPRYLHLPLAVDAQGLKLSKSSDAPKVEAMPVGQVLLAVLRFLGQSPPPDLALWPRADALGWASAHWQMNGFKGRAQGAAAAVDEPHAG
jgi:glutamyl-Q tRNA(Asp) synthetase